MLRTTVRLFALTFRRKRQLILVACLVALNVLIIRVLVVNNKSEVCGVGKTSSVPSCGDTQRYTITVVLQDFEEFRNDVDATARNLSSSEVKVVIVADSVPYPPLNSLNDGENVRLLLLRRALGQSYERHRPGCLIELSEYVVIVPDAVRCVGSCFEQAIRIYEERTRADPSVALVAFPVFSGARSKLRCYRLLVDARRWTLHYEMLAPNTTVCDAVDGDNFVVLLKAKTLLSFAFPFIRPLHSTVFVQSALNHLRVSLEPVAIAARFVQSTTLFDEKTGSHNMWKHKQLEHERRKKAFAELGVKLVRKLDSRDEWFGCGKETDRCFGTVIDDMPRYLHSGRWTPPCCLRALRETARHVFRVLASQGVRYWLEGGALLGAVRSGDIIPWDYDVDVGIYRDDIERSEFISFCRDKREPFVDSEGYVWEKASEGDFYRVQYSQTNHLHVDIFPFYSRNGTMTKDTWFKTHRQDTEFPEAFLRPIDGIKFVGVTASAPNNARLFLELKFGAGVVENPRFPNDVIPS